MILPPVISAIGCCRCKVIRSFSN